MSSNLTASARQRQIGPDVSGSSLLETNELTQAIRDRRLLAVLGTIGLTVSIVKKTEVTKAMIERPQTFAAHVQAAMASGLRLSDYARREGLSVQVLHQYRKRE